MAGLIMGALAGAGRAMEGVGEQRIRGAIDEDLIRVRSEVEQERTIALEKARMQIGDQQRQQTLQRRQEAKTGIINSAIGEKYADAKPADPSTWTAEQQAAVDQSKALDRKTMENDINLDVRAALQTGEISPKDAAALSQRDAANETRMAIAQLRAEAQNARTQALYDSAMARVEAMEARAKAASGSGNIGREERLRYTTLFTDAGRRLAETRKTLSTLQKSALFSMNSQQEGTSEYVQKKELEEAIKNYQEERSMWQGLLSGAPSEKGKKLGEDEDASAAPSPADQAAPANRRPLSNFMK
jgi:hypothetical protein